MIGDPDLVRPRVGIVGAGPVGVTAAILLKQMDLDVTVLERRDGTCLYPQAHVVNTRTSEILRELGAYDSVAAAAAPPDKLKFVTWSESLAGTRFGRLPYQGDAEAIQRRLMSSPARTLNIAQDKLERILVERLREVGGDIHFGHEVVAAEVCEGKGRLKIRGADRLVSEQTFDYVLACDGAGSATRRALGIDMEGPASLARFVHAYFKADLSQYLGDDSGPVHFICGPDVRGAFIGFDLAQTWAFLCAMPENACLESFPPEVVRELIRRAVGDLDAKLDLVHVGSWNMSGQVAASYRRGPFFLLGDAAHRFPPTGGLGLNTGIQDAHNLAWKLAFVIKGKAQAALLDSYEQERKPVAVRNCDHSIRNAMRMVEVDQEIGMPTLAPVDPAVVDRAPAVMPDHELDQVDATGRSKRQRIQDAINAQRRHFEALDIEIGFRYRVDTGGDETIQTEDDDAEIFVPRFVPGGRLPHFRVRTKDGVVPVHDVLRQDAYTLLLPAGTGTALHAQLERTGRRDLPLAVFEVEIDDTYVVLPNGRGQLDGALLVRPDGHIAWIEARSQTEPGTDALANVLALIANGHSRLNPALVTDCAS